MPKVLLIDDSKTIHKVASLILKGGLYKLLRAETSEEGEKIALKEKPEIALIDYTIQPLNGLELIKKFTGNPNLKSIKTALLHGHFQKIDDQALASVGALGKLSKPFDAHEFLKLLEALTNKEPAPKEPASALPPPSVEPEPAKQGFVVRDLTKKKGEPKKEIPKIVEEPTDEFKSFFDDDELEECLEFLEKPLTPEKVEKKQPPKPVLKASDVPVKAAGVLKKEGVSRETIEKVCWEVIPPLAEKIIREEIQKLLKETT